MLTGGKIVSSGSTGGSVVVKCNAPAPKGNGSSTKTPTLDVEPGNKAAKKQVVGSQKQTAPKSTANSSKAAKKAVKKATAPAPGKKVAGATNAAPLKKKQATTAAKKPAKKTVSTAKSSPSAAAVKKTKTASTPTTSTNNAGVRPAVRVGSVVTSG